MELNGEQEKELINCLRMCNIRICHACEGQIEKYVPLDHHLSSLTIPPGMRKFRVDQDFLIERWHTIHIMSILFVLKLSFNTDKLNIYHKKSID